MPPSRLVAPCVHGRCRLATFLALSLTWVLALGSAPLSASAAPPAPAPPAAQEIRAYQGQALSPFDRDYDNSIRGPQKVDPGNFRLQVDGLVAHPLSLTYAQVVKMDPQRRVVLLPCVEGWSERLLVDGTPLTALFARARPRANATWAVFHSADGYSTALPLADLAKSHAMLGHHVNGLPLDARRGFPFQLVAEGKLGYKWAKWVVRVELTDHEVLGYWEQRGYGNEADSLSEPPLLEKLNSR
ncbi:MAG: molybdopterin-dependent oxidoreductase [Deltaproteobacteria bacterium]|nr:molybdopterin-dependent oxidoreductase [Deltaproteobacteria bacterium]